jgi:hypothetical protein
VARDSSAAPPQHATVSTVSHRVPFYETDAMGIVHHANYVTYRKLAIQQHAPGARGDRGA